jgi:PH and SEC7 domain-containing protein
VRGHRISSSDSSACRKSRIPVNTTTRIPSFSAPQSPQSGKPRYQSQIPTANGMPQQNNNQKKQNPRFEAYMMTGDLILNLSRTPQNTNILPTQVKKSVDSLRDSPARNLKRKNGTAPKAIYDSSPSESSSPSISEMAAFESAENFNLSADGVIKMSKLYSKGNSQRHNNESLDEEEEQLLCDDDNSEDDEKKVKYNLSNKGCASITSSSSNSSPTNTNSNSSANNNYDSGGEIEGDPEKLQNNLLLSEKKNKKYSVLRNKNLQQQQQQQQPHQQHHLNVTPSASMSSTTTTTSSASTTINRSEAPLTLSPDISHSMPGSPTTFSASLLEVAKRRETANSVPNSPECIQQEAVVRRNSSNTQNQHNGINLRKCDASGFRTSRSEDHLQHSQREGAIGSAIPIDIDEDVNSSLNTLLDTRQDFDDSQVRMIISFCYVQE